MSEVIEWNKGIKTRAAHTAAEVILASDDEIEHWHDWVQWAFPIPEASRAVFGAPVADIDTLREMGKDTEVSMSLYSRYMEFLLNTRAKWATHPDHNWLRISRAIRSLVLQGLQDEADKMYAYCLQQTESLPIAQIKAWPHWNAAHNGFAL